MEGLSGKVTGVVKRIDEVMVFESGFKKLSFRVEVMDNGYPNILEFSLLKDNVDKAKFLTVGQSAEIDFNLRTREHNDRIYTELVSWKIFGKAESANDPCAKIEEEDVPSEPAPF